MRSEELCRVYCRGSIFEGWTTVSVSRSIDDAASLFTLNITEPKQVAPKWVDWQIKPGDPIRISLAGVTALTGYVDVRQASYDANNHGVQISGRGMTADAVDSAVQIPGGQLQGYKIDEIARRVLQPFGIGLSVLGAVGAAFPNVQVQQGETAFELIERLARMRGFNVHDDAEGNLVLSKADPGAAPVAGLIEGVNIKSATGVLDASQQVSELTVLGSGTGDDQHFGEDVTELGATATNSAVERHRPQVLLSEQQGDRRDMQMRADREMAKLAADTAQVNTVVYGWLTGSGALWKPGDLVPVKSPMLLIDRVMAVRAVEFRQDSGGGTETSLELVVPEGLTDAAPAAEPPPAEDAEDPMDNWSGIRSPVSAV